MKHGVCLIHNCGLNQLFPTFKCAQISLQYYGEKNVLLGQKGEKVTQLPVFVDTVAHSTCVVIRCVASFSLSATCFSWDIIIYAVNFQSHLKPKESVGGINGKLLNHLKFLRESRNFDIVQYFKMVRQISRIWCRWWTVEKLVNLSS